MANYYPQQQSGRRVVYADGQDPLFQQAANAPPPIYPNQIYHQRSDDPTVSSTNTDVMVVEDHTGRRMILSPAPSVQSTASVNEGMQIRYNNILPSGGPPHVVSTMPTKQRALISEQPLPEQPIRKRNWCWISIFIIIFLVCIGAFGTGIYFTTRQESVKSSTTPDSPTSAPSVEEEEQQAPTVATMFPTPMPTTSPTRPPTASPTKSPTSEAIPTTTQPPNSNSVPTVPNPLPTFSSFSEEFVNAFLPSSADEEFYWIELLTYKELADYNDGLETTIPGESTDNIYKNWITEDVLPNIDGAEMLFHAKVNDADYDDVIVIKYPSGQAFEQYVLDSDDLDDIMRHRMAGIDSSNSVLMATRLLVDDVPELLRQAPNANDISSSNSLFFETLHFRESVVDPMDGITSLTGREAIEKFDELSAPLKAKYGFRAAGWFDVESVAMFDSNQKPDQIRFEFVPSMLSFSGLISEEGQAEIWKYNGAALIEDSIGAFTDVDEDSALFNLYS